ILDTFECLVGDGASADEKQAAARDAGVGHAAVIQRRDAAPAFGFRGRLQREYRGEGESEERAEHAAMVSEGAEVETETDGGNGDGDGRRERRRRWTERTETEKAEGTETEKTEGTDLDSEERRNGDCIFNGCGASRLARRAFPPTVPRLVAC